MRKLFIALLFAGCNGTPAAPVQTPTVAPATAVAQPAQQTPPQQLVDTLTAKIPVLGKCERWGSDTTRLCQPTATTLIWCTAPENGDKPKCEVAADWTPKAQEAKAEPEAPKKKK